MLYVAPGKARVAWQEAFLRQSDNTNIWTGLAQDWKEQREMLAELRQVIEENPVLDFRPNYTAGVMMLLPHLTPVKKVAQILNAVMLLDLHAGQTEEAFKSMRASLLMVAHYDNEAVLISQFVRYGCHAINFNMLWEAWQSDAWNDSQWQELQQILEATDILRPAMMSLEMEQAFSANTFQKIRNNPALLRSWAMGAGNTSVTSIVDQVKAILDEPKEAMQDFRLHYIWPYWASYHHELNNLKQWEYSLQAILDTTKNENIQKSSINLRAWIEDCTDGRCCPDDPIESMFANARASEGYLKKIAAAETLRRMAIVAIALKRYHHQHQSYPEKLEGLVPVFLKAVLKDIMDGQSLRYRLNTNGTFTLYSVGEDGIDQGGEPGTGYKSDTRPTLQRGKDWVWPQPATAAEVDQYNESLDKSRFNRRRK
ncbi:MAG: hypothetical protein WCO56_27480 [Verrucomicrobiota bacterium]